MTALIAGLPGLNVGLKDSSSEPRQAIPDTKTTSRIPNNYNESTNSQASASSSQTQQHHRNPRNRSHRTPPVCNGLQITDLDSSPGSPALQLNTSLDSASVTGITRKKPPRIDSVMAEQMRAQFKSRKHQLQMQSMDFDSEPTYYRMQVNFFCERAILTGIFFTF